MPAGADRFAPAGTETPVMHGGGDTYPGLPMDDDRPLAVLLVTDTGARFTGTYPLAPLIAKLRPVETDFRTAAAFAEGDENSGPGTSDLLDPALTPSPRSWAVPKHAREPLGGGTDRHQGLIALLR
ncbi:hypothetical protein NX794_17900 [Streptomyces sp. LP11]|uniref:Uncharacterized protein n=1 Tax=Streptomyces pyxinicus TaxID=2970331 RepID=A0ABT2B3G8_9ACTN|nr:hypothetical protein [Streptomyces sp. LP11]MCS0603070.1 hypothetical protein [Streptomyces sp. LP11]